MENCAEIWYWGYATNYTSGKPISLYKRMDGMFYYSTGKTMADALVSTN